MEKDKKELVAAMRDGKSIESQHVISNLIIYLRTLPQEQAFIEFNRMAKGTGTPYGIYSAISACIKHHDMEYSVICHKILPHFSKSECGTHHFKVCEWGHHGTLKVSDNGLGQSIMNCDHSLALEGTVGITEEEFYKKFEYIHHLLRGMAL